MIIEDGIVRRWQIETAVRIVIETMTAKREEDLLDQEAILTENPDAFFFEFRRRFWIVAQQYNFDLSMPDEFTARTYPELVEELLGESFNVP